MHHFDYDHTLSSKFSQYEHLRDNASPVNSYLSNYKYSNSRPQRDMSVKSAPPKLKKSQTRERLLNRQLGPTNNTIFNEIFENRETKDERSYLNERENNFHVNFKNLVIFVYSFIYAKNN